MTTNGNPAAGQTLVTFLLDRSGSMDAIKAATIEAFNAYLDTLKAGGDGIEFSFLQFDTQSLDKICVNEPVTKVQGLTPLTYQPRGGTPLIDAAYKTIKAVESALPSRKDKPKIVVCIQTDGEENQSTEHTWESLSALVKAKIADGWQFNFMGAGIDAYAQGAKMGIAAMSTMSYDPSKVQTTLAAFAASAHNTMSYASGDAANTDYSFVQRGASGDAFAHKAAQAPDLDLTTAASTASKPKRPQTVSDFTL